MFFSLLYINHICGGNFRVSRMMSNAVFLYRRESECVSSSFVVLDSNIFARDSIDFTWRTQRDDGEEVAAFQCRLFVQSSFFSNYLLLSLVSCVTFFFKLFSCRPVSLHCAMSNLRRQPVVDRLTILSKRRNNNKDCKCTSLFLFIFSRVLSVQLISDGLPINPNPEQHKQLPLRSLSLCTDSERDAAVRMHFI